MDYDFRNKAGGSQLPMHRPATSSSAASPGHHPMYGYPSIGQQTPGYSFAPPPPHGRHHPPTNPPSSSRNLSLSLSLSPPPALSRSRSLSPSIYKIFDWVNLLEMKYRCAIVLVLYKPKSLFCGSMIVLLYARFVMFIDVYNSVIEELWVYMCGFSDYLFIFVMNLQLERGLGSCLNPSIV